MSGLYDIRRFTDGYYDDNVYFNNPLDYLANEHDAGRLAELRKMDIILTVGQTDPLLGVTWRMAPASLDFSSASASNSRSTATKLSPALSAAFSAASKARASSGAR